MMPVKIAIDQIQLQEGQRIILDDINFSKLTSIFRFRLLESTTFNIF